MTKKLEELLNLPESKEIIDEEKKKAKLEAKEEQKETFREIAEFDKITAALPQVKGLGQLADTELNDVADKAVGYGMPGVTVDGQDVLSVHEVVKEAVLRARNGDGPTLIECKTLSFLGHYPTMLKLEDIRDIKENQKWRKRDPLQILETHGKDKKYITDADLELINKQVAEEIESSVEISQKTPPTSRESAFKEIYKNPFGEI